MPEQVFAPTFSLLTDVIYDVPICVAITSATNEAEIYYTTETNGAPTVRYTTPIVVDATTTIKAIAKKDSYLDSELAVATYQFSVTGQALAPRFEPDPSMGYNEPKIITLATDTRGALIYYSFGKEDATNNLYTGPFQLSTAATVYAKASKAGLADSPVTEASYQIDVAGAKPTPILVSARSSWYAPANGQVELVWQMPTNIDLTAFKIRYGITPGVYTSSVTVTTQYYRSFIVKGLQENTAYYFSIQAIYGSIYGFASNEIYCKTPSRPELILNELVTETLSPPQIGGVSATISWRYSSDVSNVHHYQIKLSSNKIDGNNGDAITPVVRNIIVSPTLPPPGGTRTEFTLDGLIAGILYSISIIPFLGEDGEIRGLESNHVSFIKTTPFHAVPMGSSVLLAWNQLPLNFSHSIIIQKETGIPATIDDGTTIYSGIANEFIVGA